MRITSSAAAWARLCVASVTVAVLSSLAAHADSARERTCGGVDYNAMILDIIKSLPTGGGFSRGADFQPPTVTAHNIGAGRWEMRVYDGHPSYCTSATYAVYAHLAATLHNGGRIHLTADQIRSLEVPRTMPDGTARVDGEGPFWIFNANGAGAAALLKHTGTGMSFRDDKLSYARPGDFLKLFWNENVGASESGHQVVYLGHREMAGRDMICFWGSQHQGKKKRSGGTEALYLPAAENGEVRDGYGEACRPRSDIKAMIFSRVTCMEHLAAGLEDMRAKAEVRRGQRGAMPDQFVDEFLYSLAEHSSDQATLDRTYDIAPSPQSFADVMSGPPQ